MTAAIRQYRVGDIVLWLDGERLRRGRVVGWCDERGVYIVEDPTWSPRRPGCGWELIPYDVVRPDPGLNPNSKPAGAGNQ